jgi:hypothetical protein
VSDDHLAFVGALLEAVKRGDFRRIEANFPLEKVLQTPAPEDSLVREFRCAGCGARFQLYANTSNGRNWWVGKPRPEMAY